MSREFKYSRKYYGDREIYKRATVDINTGPTVLIGCNGSGKSTLIFIIKEALERNNVPFLYYNNLNEGGNYSMQNALVNQDFDTLSSLALASEGEQITMNICNKGKEMFRFLKTGLTDKDRKFMLFSRALDGKITKFETRENSNERWFLFDAIDSGYSIDNVMDFKEYIIKPLMVEAEKQNKEAYFIISANEYEMCVDFPCFNVVYGKYVNINSYEDYKKQILKTRQYKEKSVDLYESKIKIEE